MSEAKTFHVELIRTVEITINDPDVIERVTGPNGDNWREQLYNLHTEEDVLAHLAGNCLANGQENASNLDGWGDLPVEAVQMKVLPGLDFFAATPQPGEEGETHG
jgi:hypothetical protein